MNHARTIDGWLALGLVIGLAAWIIPVVQALLGKGTALGTALVFVMAVIGLSLPEAVILRKVLTIRLLLTFLGVVAVGILVVGCVFNGIM